MIGAHVGPACRTPPDGVHTLDFRAGTALFGHFGVEWDLTGATESDRARLAQWIRLYKELRPLLHNGTGPARCPLRWWNSGVELSGRTLAVAGVQAPVLFPERLVLIRATRH
jgi:hypothetical protein